MQHKNNTEKHDQLRSVEAIPATQEKKTEEGEKKTGRITPSSVTKPLRYATLKYATTLGGTEPAMPTADRRPLDKYQLLFVVNLVKLHLTAYKRTPFVLYLMFVQYVCIHHLVIH